MGENLNIKEKYMFKKHIAIVIFLLAALFRLYSQGENEYELNWKIDDDEIVKYGTIMKVVDQSDISFKNLFADESDNKEIYKTLDKMAENLITDLNNTKYTTVLFKDSDDIIQIKMLGEPLNEEQEKGLYQLYLDLTDGIMLRGAINKNGGIESFWLKSGQKNMISMFFELPTQPVKIGETWELNVNYIENDQSFICENSHRKNNVTLEKVVIEDEEEIAVLKYDIEEFVSGNLLSVFNKENGMEPIEMEFSYKAIGEFSLSKGRWLKYNGLLKQKISGYMDNESIQELSLIEM